jgi:hypothetical protein
LFWPLELLLFPTLEEPPLLLPPLPPTKAQTPLAHSKPPQQSSVVVQLCPELWQTPRPPLELEPLDPALQAASQPKAATANDIRFNDERISSSSGLSDGGRSTARASAFASRGPETLPERYFGGAW